MVEGDIEFQSVSAGGGFAGGTMSGAFTCGLDTAGTAYCWGWNPVGQIGDGTMIDRRIPVAYGIR